MSVSMQVRLSKHHGLRNDFLVYDLAQGDPGHAWGELAVKWCDRHAGIGADGLLLLQMAGDRNLSMRLFNADGSIAEMSGNGIRCLVQAAHRAMSGSVGDVYTVATDAGTRVVEVVSDDGDTLHLSVEMGFVSDLAEPEGWSALECDPMRPVRHVSLGNPHSVVGVEDVKIVDLARLGALVPHINLEIVEPGPGTNAITMRVHERGAGITAACGTGACAAADAALAWGIVPRSVEEVVVHMDGGIARVRVSDSRSATLIGPTVFIGDVVMGDVTVTA